MPHSLSHLDHIPCPVTWYSTPVSMGSISMSLWRCMTCSIWDIPFGSRLLSHDMTFRPLSQWDLAVLAVGPRSLSLISMDLWSLSLISVDLVPRPSSQWTSFPVLHLSGPLVPVPHLSGPRSLSFISMDLGTVSVFSCSWPVIGTKSQFMFNKKQNGIRKYVVNIRREVGIYRICFNCV